MKSLIDRLGLDCELSGHGGCVNCIEWNQEGTILASGSDDFHVRLWDPFRKKRLADIDTGHQQGFIFSVKVHTSKLNPIFYYKFNKSCLFYSLCPIQKLVWLPAELVMVLSRFTGWKNNQV